MENTENTISETLDFKIVWERMSPDPPYKLPLPRSFAIPPDFNIGSAVPDSITDQILLIYNLPH